MADTAEAKKIQYRLRYEVYRDEVGVEDKEQFPEQQEIDEWDEDAVHFLVRHKFSGQWLGALRLVVPKQNGLPFEGSALLHRQMSPASYRQALEISRLCIVKDARRFVLQASVTDQMDVEKSHPNVTFMHDRRNTNRAIMWGLYRAAAVYSAQHGIKQWYISITPALAYFVSKEGFDARQIGDPYPPQGQLTPYWLSVEHVLENPLWAKDYQNDYRLFSDLDQASLIDGGRRQVRHIGAISFVSRL